MGKTALLWERAASSDLMGGCEFLKDFTAVDDVQAAPDSDGAIVAYVRVALVMLDDDLKDDETEGLLYLVLPPPQRVY